jgi:hypothetical protein
VWDSGAVAEVAWWRAKSNGNKWGTEVGKRGRGGEREGERERGREGERERGREGEREG